MQNKAITVTVAVIKQIKVKKIIFSIILMALFCMITATVSCSYHAKQSDNSNCCSYQANQSEKDYLFNYLDGFVLYDSCREYARGRRERRNRFRPADVAYFSSKSDKNVALIFCKIRCFNIHFNIHTCHQLVFDLGRSSIRYPSGLHKKSIRSRGPVWEGS